jgi:hypothetical protein
MRTTEPFFSAFIVEVWNSTRTTKITGPIRVSGVWDAALGAYKQKEVLFFKGLTRGVVYSLRAAVATSHGGPVSAWTAWIDETAGDTTAPSSTYTPTWSAIANGAICSVAVSGAASDLDRYEWYGNTTGIAPSASTPSNWPNTPKSADVRQTFAGTAGQTIYAWIRGVDTSGNRQAWQTLNTKSVGTIDDVADGPTYARVLGTRVTLGVPYVYRGEWVGSTSYLRGDEVAYPSAAAGNIYACMTANSDASWTVAHWLLIGPASVDQVADGSTFARTTPNQRDGGGRGYAAIDSGNVVVAAGLDFSRGYTGKHLDNIPDGSTYGRPKLTGLTAGEVDLSKAGVINKSADHIAEGASRKWAGESGADITGSHQAATIAGQGALATKGSVDLSTTEVTNKSADHIAEGASRKWAGESGADITGSHQAATIAGQGGLATKSSVDLATGEVTNKSLDNVADGTRVAWTSGTQKAAAVDASGNILLKNVEVVNGSTSGPVLTCDGTYQTVTDLSITITTNGNQVYLSFATGFSATDGFSAYMVYFALFRDTTRVSPEYGIQATDSMQYTAMGVYIDSPTAASHTFTVKCKAGTGVYVTLVGTQRSFSAIELG